MFSQKENFGLLSPKDILSTFKINEDEVIKYIFPRRCKSCKQWKRIFYRINERQEKYRCICTECHLVLMCSSFFT